MSERANFTFGNNVNLLLSIGTVIYFLALFLDPFRYLSLTAYIYPILFAAIFHLKECHLTR